MSNEFSFMQQGFPVFSGENALSLLEELLNAPNDFSKMLVLCDDNTYEHCLPILKRHLPSSIPFDFFKMKSGESSKSLSVCESIWQKMTAMMMSRNDLLINLGGGVVCDVGGFVAATYLRGISFLNIPTSVMGMVDAGLGGKNGIDLNHHKNRIGSFAFPIATVCDPVFLKTLPDAEWKNGCAEVFKHALIGDARLFETLSVDGCTRANFTSLLHSIQGVKLKVVEDDPFEDGFRKVLNFGHTVGHAIESASLKKDSLPLSHGEAVAMGMIIENEIMFNIGGLDASIKNNCREVLEKHLTEVKITSYTDVELLEWIQYDKKNANGIIRMSLITSIGSCSWNVEVPQEIIRTTLQNFR
ncbi:MAG: 3-dehydroquinate synthase [Bacteroidetes bacterium]|nr:3-dehydroquinate synthase [Bacteroidota bacterium]